MPQKQGRVKVKPAGAGLTLKEQFNSGLLTKEEFKNKKARNARIIRAVEGPPTQRVSHRTGLPRGMASALDRASKVGRAALRSTRKSPAGIAFTIGMMATQKPKLTPSQKKIKKLQKQAKGT